MKRILSIFSLLAILVCGIGATTPAAARKDRFASKLNTFNSIVKELQTHYVDTLNADELMNRTIAALLYQIDPYTEYYPSGDQDELLSISQGQYAGIGAVISKRGNTVIVNEPQDGSPSKRAGMRPGDVILRINGDTVTPSMAVDQVSKRLRGQAGTDITIDVRRPFVDDSLLTFSFVRDNIKVNPLPYYGVDADGVGYIRLTTFNESSARHVREAVAKMLQHKNLKGIVLDLRDNGGGLLDGAVQIASNFVPKGTEILRTKGREARDVKIFKTTTHPLDTRIPLAILTDGGTASASEIVAGSMQDLDRAVIIGERSYGKGLVQTPLALPYDDLLKVTTGRYYIPSGRLIQALDYSHRNDDGSPVRTPDSLTNEFRTHAGRIVRDGGGITPDITVKVPETNRLLYNIIADMWAFDFANKKYAAEPTAPDTLVTDATFEEFKAFIDPARFKYDRRCEQVLDMLRESAKTEGYMTDSVAAQFDILAAMLKHDLNHDLDLNRAQISEILDTELAARYYSEAERVARTLPSDSTYLRAKEILLKPEEYDKILSAPSQR